MRERFFGFCGFLTILCSGLVILVTSFFSGPAYGQTTEYYTVNGLEYLARRDIRILERKPVVVTAFYHHGLLPSEGSCGTNEVLVIAKNGRKPVPAKVLQLGPGDFCKLAFETTARDIEYTIHYGLSPNSAKATPNPALPEWTEKRGLVLEIREFSQCDMNNLASVKAAFDKSKRVSSDYVEGIQHVGNPFVSRQVPFLSRYTGTLNIAQAGEYGFFTSSQDCSFLLIDGKEVVSAPGRHGPARQARPENVGIVSLTAGPHSIEYHHASGSDRAVMVVAWEANPDRVKPKPDAIPKEAFDPDIVVRTLPESVSLAGARTSPDFISHNLGSVPLPDNPDNLVCVRFENKTPGSLGSAKCTWDFGDGQTSTEKQPDHIYLKPGLYTVKLSYTPIGGPVEITNRIFVDQPLVQPDPPHELNEAYLSIIEKYDLKTLDTESAVQLARAYLAKVDKIFELTNQVDESLELLPRQYRDQVVKYRRLAVGVAKTVLENTGKTRSDEGYYNLANLCGPVARDLLGDSDSAEKIWLEASKKIGSDEKAVECAAVAADIVLNDLLDTKRAQSLLDAAIKRLPNNVTGPGVANIYRVAGEIQASNGESESAMKSFATAEEKIRSRKSYGEKTALQGAFSRSVEGFIREGNLDRAIGELREWQREYPGNAVDGYASLLFAEFWFKKGKYDRAAALADRLIILNPDSGYSDRILNLAAEAKIKAGDKPGALAYLHQILKEYPGSEMIENVKKKIVELEK